MARDYKKENEYKAKPEQIKMRVERNKARRAAIKAGKAKVGDGTSVEHIKPLSKGGKSTPKNTKLVSFADNSSYDRNSDKSVRVNTPGIFKKKKKTQPKT
jgi:predicted transcriptional regulator